MNLKNFHIVFILVSALLCAFLVYWGINRQDVLGKVLAGLGGAGVLVLMGYGRAFLAKMAKLKMVAVTALVVAMGYAPSIFACSSCFSGAGEGSAGQLNGLRWSVMFLLGIVFCILSAFGGFVMFLVKSERKGAL